MCGRLFHLLGDKHFHLTACPPWAGAPVRLPHLAFEVFERPLNIVAPFGAPLRFQSQAVVLVERQINISQYLSQKTCAEFLSVHRHRRCSSISMRKKYVRPFSVALDEPQLREDLDEMFGPNWHQLPHALCNAKLLNTYEMCRFNILVLPQTENCRLAQIGQRLLRRIAFGIAARQ